MCRKLIPFPIYLPNKIASSLKIGFSAGSFLRGTPFLLTTLSAKV
jgi:hypothetical protein